MRRLNGKNENKNSYYEFLFSYKFAKQTCCGQEDFGEQTCCGSEGFVNQTCCGQEGFVK